MEEEKGGFLTIVDSASNLPLVHIEREKFLKNQFSARKYDDIREDIILLGPLEANVHPYDVERLAKHVINFETTKVTMISAVSGIPGGIAMAGTIPADLTQFYGHVLRVIQELMYLYGFEEINDMDDETKNIMIIFIGAMSGVQGAEKAIGELCKVLAKNATNKFATKAFAKGTIYPIAKQICKQLGIKLTKQMFSKGVSKAIPFIGAGISGTMTFATFKPMCYRLLKILKENCH